MTGLFYLTLSKRVILYKENSDIFLINSKSFANLIKKQNSVDDCYIPIEKYCSQ